MKMMIVMMQEMVIVKVDSKVVSYVASYDVSKDGDNLSSPLVQTAISLYKEQLN